MSQNGGVGIPKVPSMPEAIAKVFHAHRIFGDGVARLNSDDQKERDNTDKAIRKIVKDFKLEAIENELRAALLEAAEAYWIWWAYHHRETEGLGDKDNVASLESALARAEGLLKDAKIRNRIEKVAKTANRSDLPTAPSAGPYYEFGECTFESVSRARAAILGLLHVTRLASKLDGRNPVGKGRDDIRAAARPLRTYWAKVAKKSGKLGQRGGIHSPAVRFLHGCLQLIDQTVTLTLVVALDS